jgi:hypothetical protein
MLLLLRDRAQLLEKSLILAKPNHLAEQIFELVNFQKEFVIQH